jgi:hypothetical protein
MIRAKWRLLVAGCLAAASIPLTAGVASAAPGAAEIPLTDEGDALAQLRLAHSKGAKLTPAGRVALNRGTLSSPEDLPDARVQGGAGIVILLSDVPPEAEKALSEMAAAKQENGRTKTSRPMRNKEIGFCPMGQRAHGSNLFSMLCPQGLDGNATALIPAFSSAYTAWKYGNGEITTTNSVTCTLAPGLTCLTYSWKSVPYNRSLLSGNIISSAWSTLVNKWCGPN